MKTKHSLILGILTAIPLVAAEINNPAIEYGGFRRLTQELEPVRAKNRVSEEDFRKIFSFLDGGADNWKSAPAPVPEETKSILRDSAVKPEKRGEYLRVLSREADRLSHLVEYVLSFSGIERGSARSVVREMTVFELLEPMRERLKARLFPPPGWRSRWTARACFWSAWTRLRWNTFFSTSSITRRNTHHREGLLWS